MKAEIGVYPKDRQILHEIVPLDTPFLIDFHVSNICNFRCNYCLQSASQQTFDNSGFKREFMSWETFKLGVSQIKDFPHKLKQLTFVGQGEPTLNKRLVEMITEVRKADIAETVMLITNASTLSPDYNQQLVDAGLQVLRISLQGMSASKYQQISQAKIDWEKFYYNIVNFSRIRGECKLKVKIADTALEEGDEQKFYELFGEICDAVAIEHIFDSYAHLGREIEVPLVETSKNRFGHPIQKVNVCWFPFIRMDFRSDGVFSNCCGALFGFEKNIRDSSMVHQWNSQEMNKMRKDFLLHDLSKYTACQKCHILSGDFHPEDILDGYENEILARMQEKN